MTDHTLRIIFHVDVNSAFLSWSALKRLREEPGSVDLRTIPSAVGGDIKTRHGVITAKSIPAKKYGVKTGEPVVKALQKCPQLMLVPSDFETYRTCSHQLMDLLSVFTPLLQQISIDEAWLDVTDLVYKNTPDGKDPDTIYSPDGTSSTDDSDAPEGDTSAMITENPEEDICTGSADVREKAVILAGRIRQQVRDTLGFTVNVGISSNKLLAKMASDFQKPDRTHTLWLDEVPSKMWPLPVGELYGCGKATADRLASVGIRTIGDAAAADLQTLQALLGKKAGLYIARSARGIGSVHVNPEREKAKSISNERTLSEDINETNYETNGIPVIHALCEKVASRAQKAGSVGQTVTFQVKTSDFQRHSRQLALPEPTDQAGPIETAALQLADRLLSGPEGLFSSGQSIRLIGVGISRITEKQMQKPKQLDLFSWAEENRQLQDDRKSLAQKQARLDDMLQSVNSRFGDGHLRKGFYDSSFPSPLR